MSFYRKIKSIVLENKRRFLILFVVECLFLLIAIIGLFGKNNVYTYDYSDASVAFGRGEEVPEGIKLDENSGDSVQVRFANIEIPRGVYYIELNYQSNTDFVSVCKVTDETIGYKMLRVSGEVLYSGLDKTNFQMWLLEGTKGLTVSANYGGQGELVIKGLTIRETNAMNRIFLFVVLLLSLLINVIYIFVLFDRTYSVSKKNKLTIFGLGIIILFSSIPVMQDRIPYGGDLVYHLMRIEGIKDGILNGQFPVRIAPEWLQGYGYASSIFYGETVMYVAALFRMIGFSVTTSYRIYMFLINVATVLISFYCFDKIFKEKYIALLCTMLYSLSIYHTFKTYAACALGEAHAMLFLPLILYGFYRVYTEDIEDKKYSRSYIPLMIGFAGIIQSHMLTGEIVGIFTILLCLILWKRTFRRKTFMVLAKTVIGFLLLSLWFIVPFADYMLTGNFVIQNVWAREIQQMGGYIAHHFVAFSIPGSKTLYSVEGMFESNPTSIGIALFFVLFVWIGILFLRKTRCLTREELTMGRILLFFSIFSLLLGLSIFPWDRIQSTNQSIAVLVSSLQFPHRFSTIANICLVTLAGLTTKCIMDYYEDKGLQIWVLLLTILTLISGIHLFNEMIYSDTAVQIYNDEGMGSGYISGEEYLPFETDASLLLYQDPKGSEGVLITDYEKDGLKINLSFENTSERDGVIELPLLYYKGYRAVNKATGEKLELYLGDNSVVTAKLEPLSEGELYVSFVSPWYWRLAECISALALMFLVLKYGVRRKNSGKE